MAQRATSSTLVTYSSGMGSGFRFRTLMRYFTRSRSVSYSGVVSGGAAGVACSSSDITISWSDAGNRLPAAVATKACSSQAKLLGDLRLVRATEVVGWRVRLQAGERLAGVDDRPRAHRVATVLHFRIERLVGARGPDVVQEVQIIYLGPRRH